MYANARAQNWFFGKYSRSLVGKNSIFQLELFWLRSKTHRARESINPRVLRAHAMISCRPAILSVCYFAYKLYGTASGGSLTLKINFSLIFIPRDNYVSNQELLLLLLSMLAARSRVSNGRRNNEGLIETLGNVLFRAWPFSFKRALDYNRANCYRGNFF